MSQNLKNRTDSQTNIVKDYSKVINYKIIDAMSKVSEFKKITDGINVQSSQCNSITRV